MPEYLRSLVVILALATAVFAFAKTPVCALASNSSDFERRRNLWFGITLVAFLAHSFWVFIAITAVLLLCTLPREPNRLAMFFFLLFAVPAFPEEIPGLGLINYFFTIDYVRLLTLVVLLPAFWSLVTRPDVERFGRLLPDKLIAGYIVLQFALMLTASTVTNTSRYGAFYAFVDIFLPYYVASRSLRNLQGFRDALMGFVTAALVLAAIGTFEYLKSWLLYKDVQFVLGGRWWGYGNYLPRGESLRALGTVGQPIAFGYVMTVAIALFLYLRKSVANQTAWRFGLALLIAGLISSISRGPWVGAAAMFMVFLVTDSNPGRHFAKLALIGIIAVPVLLTTSAGQRIIDLLPFIGTVEADNVTFRQTFTEISIQFIIDHPWFGAYDYIYAPEMKELWGNGILDTLNTFLAVGLGSGLIGMSLFAGVFIVPTIGVFKSMRKQPDRNGEICLLGRALFSAMLGIIIILCTVSSITIIPVIYWSVAGLCVSYVRMCALAKVPEKERAGMVPSGFGPAVIKTTEKFSGTGTGR